MLYTRKGDDGTTNLFGSKNAGPEKARISKSSCQTEALGALDELNSFLGFAKVKAVNSWSINGKPALEILAEIQNSLFIVQAEIAGANKCILAHHVKNIEVLTDAIETELPPIKSFFMSGGTELSALLEISRTLARKAERRIIKAIEEQTVNSGMDLLSFMNRLSSLLYAMSRFTNFKADMKETSPWY